VQVARRNVAINRLLRNPRLRELDEGAPEDHHERHGHGDDVRTQVRQQAPHQPRVVGFAEDIVLLHRRQLTPRG